MSGAVAKRQLLPINMTITKKKKKKQNGPQCFAQTSWFCLQSISIHKNKTSINKKYSRKWSSKTHSGLFHPWVFSFFFWEGQIYQTGVTETKKKKKDRWQKQKGWQGIYRVSPINFIRGAKKKMFSGVLKILGKYPSRDWSQRRGSHGGDDDHEVRRNAGDPVQEVGGELGQVAFRKLAGWEDLKHIGRLQDTNMAISSTFHTQHEPLNTFSSTADIL